MRTRATLRRAEFGFFGVVVYTRVHTPRFCGAATFFLRPLPDLRPGVASFLVLGVRPLRTSCEVVGMRSAQDSSGLGAARDGERPLGAAGVGVPGDQPPHPRTGQPDPQPGDPAAAGPDGRAADPDARSVDR